MNLFLSIGINDKNASVIYAGADETYLIEVELNIQI